MLIDDIRIGKIVSDYGVLGLGYYTIIMDCLENSNGKYRFADLGILSARYRVADKKKLKRFIYNLCKWVDNENKTLLCANDVEFWSDSIIQNINKKAIAIENGSKGGRPKKEVIEDKIDFADFVILQQSDYKKLVLKFGEKVTNKAISILDNWLAQGSANAKKYIGKNHYYFFRKDNWVIEKALKAVEEEPKGSWGNI